MRNLKWVFTVAAALLMTMGAVAQPPEPVVAELGQAVQSPEQVIEQFVDAILNPAKLESASRLVEGGQTGEALQPLAAWLQKEGHSWRVEVERADAPIVRVNQDFVSAKIRLSMRFGLFGKIGHQEQLTLHRIGDEWKIVPLPKEEFYRSFRGVFDSDILANFATYLARPQEVYEASAYGCLSNLKQVALAAFQFVQDNDEIFALQPATLVEQLAPYARSEKVFHCPDDKSDEVSYSFNPRLENVSLAKFAEPSRTVLFYEGKNGALNFRHQNRAGVCFADGHCELVTPEQSKNLRWEP